MDAFQDILLGEKARHRTEYMFPLKKKGCAGRGKIHKHFYLIHLCKDKQEGYHQIVSGEKNFKDGAGVKTLPF